MNRDSEVERPVVAASLNPSTAGNLARTWVDALIAKVITNVNLYDNQFAQQLLSY